MQSKNFINGIKKSINQKIKLITKKIINMRQSQSKIAKKRTNIAYIGFSISSILLYLFLMTFYYNKIENIDHIIAIILSLFLNLFFLIFTVSLIWVKINQRKEINSKKRFTYFYNRSLKALEEKDFDKIIEIYNNFFVFNITYNTLLIDSIKLAFFCLKGKKLEEFKI